jgi:Uma2 family endonuclease
MSSNDEKLSVKEPAAPMYSESKRLTYADYAKWETTERYELIYGQSHMMSAPSTAHQRVSRRLLTRFDNFLSGKQCEVLMPDLKAS